MAVTTKRFSKAACEAGRGKVPDSLAGMLRLPFVWLHQRKTKRASKFTLELSSESALYLVAVYDELQAQKGAVTALEKALKEKDAQLISAAAEIEQLNRNIERIGANVREDRSRHPKSPKNYFNAAADHGFRATNNRGLQGGDAGLEKK
jgi:hypothetical protein